MISNYIIVFVHSIGMCEDNESTISNKRTTATSIVLDDRAGTRVNIWANEVGLN